MHSTIHIYAHLLLCSAAPLLHTYVIFITLNFCSHSHAHLLLLFAAPLLHAHIVVRATPLALALPALGLGQSLAVVLIQASLHVSGEKVCVL
jgi:hypothetical protein